ncbi:MULTISPECIES: methyltransferase domain-containing protein [unclassified Maridesulfovibrio]|uniref:methyltransferase domain-containing protein n=1 Tax=unclassified Maridesulfovibrio TaxID=2794999 RepID=UPI003B3F43E2
MNKFEVEEIDCPVCGCANFDLLFKRPDHTHLVSDYQFPVVRCKSCRAGYLRIRPTREGVKCFYTDDFYRLNSKENAEDKGNRRSYKKLKLFDKYVSAGRLLDVGCAGGEFVRFLNKRGWDAYGYEPMGGANLLPDERIKTGSNLLDVYSGEEFDVVTSWAVLEHVHNLQQLMDDIATLIRPGGIFISLVTNLNSVPGRFMRQDDVPRHLNFFTKKSLGILLKQHNMKPISWSFKGDIFDGSQRGMLVFGAKFLLGESMESIVAQHREPGRRHEFCGQLKGRPSKAIASLAAVDRWIAPYFDTVIESLGYGFIMTVVAQKK